MKTFHVSLTVGDLDRAVERYRSILGMEPAKLHPDFAKFEIADPPVVLSLNIGGRPGALNHLGIRHEDTEHVDAALARTKAAGITVKEQMGTTCCYAKADKFWVDDADGVPWEMYSLLADTDVHSLPDQTPDTVAVESAPKGQCCPS
jgi:catechol 2,3-dioxygenase-like lactoylglutathione lyase family enzyme